MTNLLLILSIAILIIGVISGFFMNSFFGWLITTLGSLAFASITLALMKIIQNQEKSLTLLHQVFSSVNQQTEVSLQCKNCNYEYSDSLSSCPKCGFRGNYKS
ncbi:hypothetical protein BTS2_0797 [Bacillus sp. TS-2]|nr:hypothetical protein BTS2_0797 [Bacillus sp. TS-2]